MVVRFGYVAAALCIFAALLVSITDLLTPFLNEHRQDLEKFASRLFNRPIQVGEVDISWSGFKPELEFHKVVIVDSETHQPNLEIPLIKINIAILDSLLSREFILDSLKVVGVHLTLHEQKPGEISVEGFPQILMTDNFTGHSLNPNIVLTWIFSQPKLVLQDFNVDFFSHTGDEKLVTLKRLVLNNSSRNHELTGKAILNQTIPTQISIRFDWRGSVTDLSHVSADLYLELQNISLPQWFEKYTWKTLKFKRGLGSAKVWAKWNNNTWQKIETTLQFYNIKIAMDQVFDNSLELDQLTGSLTCQKDASGTWLLTAKTIQAVNEDLHATADLSMTFPVNDSPSINLTSQFMLFNAKNVSDYLPLKIFQPELISWLRHAFLSGQIETGQAILQGKLSDFPFDNALGKFEIGGIVKNVELNYAPGWPVIHNINGKILFSGRSMTVDVASAQILEVPLQNIHADIPNLGNGAVLTAKSAVQADLAAGLQFIEQSPLKQTIGKSLSALKLTGPMQLALSLAVPLTHPADVKVIGDTTIPNAILNLPDWNLSVDQLKGAFHFTENSITASQMTGQLFGHPLTIDLLTQHPQGQTGYVTAMLQGAVNTTDLKTWLNLPIEEVMQGTTNYKAELILPPQHVSSQSTQVIIHSDLNGIAVNLPDGYGKKTQDLADFQLSFLIKENQPLKAKMLYNKLFSVAMTLQRKKQALSLLGADVRLGNGEANWPTQPGIIITGNINQINWNKIAPYLSQFTAKSSAQTSQKNLMNPDLFRGVDIQANTVNFSGFQLKNIKIQLTKTANDFVLGLNNAEMAGEITLPRGGIHQGIQAKFQRLNLSSAGGKSTINPRDLPPVSFVGDDVRYGDMMLGHATLNLQPASGGMAIKQLDLVSPSYKLHAVGTWTGARSHLQGNVTTTNLTDLLKSWGFSSNNLIASKGDADFDLNWSGGLFTPSLPELSGNVSLNLGEGRIINLDNATDAKMGLGRLLNIFSLQSLPRRLSLNFSDLFEKGYSFDSVKGDFVLRNGNAITQNTHFKGPVASIEISGRIGLAAKDLDMKIRVTPHVTSSLPVVAAIATANPIAGIATWMVDKMVSPAVSQMTTYDYSITGSWANPVWNQISAQRLQQPNQPL